MKELLTLSQAVERFPYWSARTLRLFIGEGRLASYRLGRNLYVDAADMETFIEARKVPARPAERSLKVVNG